MVVGVAEIAAHRRELRLGNGLGQRFLVADLAACGFHGSVHGHDHVIGLGGVQRGVAATVFLAEGGHEGLVGSVVQVVRPVGGVEQAQHGLAHGTNHVFIRRKTAGDQGDVFGQTRPYELLDEVDAHGAGQEEIHGIGLGGAQLGQLGRVVDLPHLGVDLVGHLALELALEAGERILARGVVGGDQHHAAKFLVGRKLAGGFVKLVVLVSRAKKVGVALRPCQLAGACVVRQVGHLGGKQRGRYGQGHVAGDGAGEQVDLFALHKAVYQLLGLVGAARHVGLHKFCGLAAQLAAQLLDGQRKPIACLGAGAGKRARHIQRHPHLDRRALGMGWGAGKCSQRGPGRQVRRAAQRCNAERAEKGCHLQVLSGESET